MCRRGKQPRRLNQDTYVHVQPCCTPPIRSEFLAGGGDYRGTCGGTGSDRLVLVKHHLSRAGKCWRAAQVRRTEALFALKEARMSPRALNSEITIDLSKNRLATQNDQRGDPAIAGGESIQDERKTNWNISTDIDIK